MNPNELIRLQITLEYALDEAGRLVPCIEMEDEIVLKTIIPSRKATRKYLRGE